MFRRRKNYELTSVYLLLLYTTLLHLTEGGPHFNLAKTSLLLPHHDNNVVVGQMSPGSLSVVVDPQGAVAGTTEAGRRNQTINQTVVNHVTSLFKANLKNAGPLLSMLLVVVNSSKNEKLTDKLQQGIIGNAKLLNQKIDIDPLLLSSSFSVDSSLRREKRKIGAQISKPVRGRKKGHSHSKKNNMAIAGSTSIANEDTAVATADAKEGTAHEAKWAQAGALTWRGGSEALAASAAGKKDFHPTGNCKSCKKKMMVAVNPVTIVTGFNTVENEVSQPDDKPSITVPPLKPLDEVRMAPPQSSPILQVQVSNDSVSHSEISRGENDSKIGRMAVQESDSGPPIQADSPVITEEEKLNIERHDIFEEKAGRTAIEVLTTHTNGTQPKVAGEIVSLEKMTPIADSPLTIVSDTRPRVAAESVVFEDKIPQNVDNPVTVYETKFNVAENFVVENKIPSPLPVNLVTVTDNLPKVASSYIVVTGQSDIAPIPDPYCPSGPNDLFNYIFPNDSSSFPQTTPPPPKSGRFLPSKDIIPNPQQPVRPILEAPIAPILPPHSAIKPEIPFEPKFQSRRPPTIILIPPPIYEPPLANQTEPFIHNPSPQLAPIPPPFSPLNYKKYGPSSQAPSLDGMPPTLLPIVEPPLAPSPPPYAPLNFGQLKRSGSPIPLEMWTDPPKIIVESPLAPSPPVFSQLTRKKQLDSISVNDTIYSSVPPVIVEPPLGPIPDPYSPLNVRYDNQPPEGYTIHSVRIKYVKNKDYSLIEPPFVQNPVSIYHAKSLVPDHPVKVIDGSVDGRSADGVGKLKLRKVVSRKSHLAASGSTSIAGEKTAISSTDAHDATRKKILAADAAAIVYSGGQESIGRSSVRSKNFDPNCKKCTKPTGEGNADKKATKKLHEAEDTKAAAEAGTIQEEKAKGSTDAEK